MHYKHILYATNGTAESAAAGERAAAVAGLFGARLSLLRVLEHLPFDEPVDPVPPEDAEQVAWYREKALDSLHEFTRRFEIPESAANVVVTDASPEKEIIRFVAENAVDLVIVGANERHGLSLFRGATTDTVVHNAPCDVLVVHL